jgi:phage FluMu protein Com
MTIDIRCKRCKGLLLRAVSGNAKIEIKCHKCKYVNTFELEVVIRENEIADNRNFMTAQA